MFFPYYYTAERLRSSFPFLRASAAARNVRGFLRPVVQFIAGADHHDQTTTISAAGSADLREKSNHYHERARFH
ncbi:MAG TPA: hypothetical protein VGD64_00925 [Acidisarcina sp.]